MRYGNGAASVPGLVVVVVAAAIGVGVGRTLR
jgi:hypothetical protein